MHREGMSYRLIGRNVGLATNTVLDIVRLGASPGVGRGQRGHCDHSSRHRSYLAQVAAHCIK